MTILILDDEKTIRKAISFALSRNGHQIIEAYNPKFVLDKLHQLKLDLIIMDIDLPVMSGFEFLKSLKSAEKNIPVIILTSQEVSDSDFHEHQIDPKKIISKESTIPRIMNVIENVLKFA